MTVICEPNPAETPAPALPRPALLTLAAATMTMVTGEMLPTAVLAPMSDGLGVSEARIGLLVSVWAATVVALSFPLVRLTRGVDRRTVIEASLWAFALSAGATAIASGFWAALAARTVGAAAVGLLWSTVNAHVADLVGEERLARANALVLGGATLGIVLGTPAARFVADLADWRIAFGGLAVAGAIVAALVRRLVPGDQPPSPRDMVGAGSRRRRPMVVVTAWVAIALAGHFGIYTFITRLAEAPAERVPGGMGTMLVLFGAASAVGVAISGRVAHQERALVIALAGTAVAGMALTMNSRAPWLGVVIVVAWGVTSGGLPPLAQTLVLKLAGPERRSLAGALVPVLFNGGIAVGAAAASGLVGAAGTGALPVAGAFVVAAATVGLVSRDRGGSPTGRRDPAGIPTAPEVPGRTDVRSGYVRPAGPAS